MVIDIKAQASAVALVMPGYATAIFYFPSKSSCSFPFLAIWCICSWIYQLATQTGILRPSTEKQGATKMNTATKKLPRSAQTHEPRAVSSSLTCILQLLVQVKQDTAFETCRSVLIIVMPEGSNLKYQQHCRRACEDVIFGDIPSWSKVRMPLLTTSSAWLFTYSN